VVFEARGADGKSERLPALAPELVRLKVDGRAPGDDYDPDRHGQRESLEGGYVASLARPGGNVTGLTSLSLPLSAKRLELARELVPGASRFVVLLNDAVSRPGGLTDLMVRSIGSRP
jgi:putative ABC transport system substrate-binding protein